jgi:hypothetical protein
VRLILVLALRLQAHRVNFQRQNRQPVAHRARRFAAEPRIGLARDCAEPHQQ